MLATVLYGNQTNVRLLLRVVIVVIISLLLNQ